MTTVSDDLAKALQDRLNSIPEGERSETARKAGMSVPQLMKLRRGKPKDVQLSTLKRLADALGEPVSAMLGEGAEDRPAPRPLAPSRQELNALKAARRHAQALLDALQKLAELERRAGE